MKTSFGAMTGRERLCFVLKYLFMALCVVVALFPIIWVILSSFKTNAEILSNGISLPTHFGFDGYQSALDMAPIFKFFGNSVIVTCCATVLNVLVFAMAGYAFARFRFPCDKLLYMLLSLSLVIPMTALLQPVYSVVNNLGLYDTKAGLILVNTALNMPMSLLILRGAFQIKNLLQVAVGVIFGYFTTFSNYLFSFLPTPDNLLIRLFMMLLSTALIAVGIFFYLPADIMPLAGEGAMKAVADVTHIPFNKVKIGFDVSMVTISLISCLIVLKTLGSVGIGTVIAALLVGMILGVVTKFFGEKRDRLLRLC